MRNHSKVLSMLKGSVPILELVYTKEKNIWKNMDIIHSVYVVCGVLLNARDDLLMLKINRFFNVGEKRIKNKEL